MIDFTNAIEEFNNYKGSENYGKKINYMSYIKDGNN